MSIETARRNSIKLKKEIINLSVSDEWEIAKKEWDVWTIFIEEGWDNCLCGQSIKECCVLRNKLNKHECIVGNVCVNNFLGITTDHLFKSVKSVAKNLTKSFSVDVISHAFTNKWINLWERGFYEDIMSLPKLSYKQKATKLKLNKKILDYFKKEM
jgi:hypothetical protein